MSLTKSLLIAGGVAVLGVGGAAFYHHKKKAGLKEKILGFVKDEQEKAGIKAIIDKMELGELEDTFTVLDLHSQQKNITDACLAARYQVITKKYNIGN